MTANEFYQMIKEYAKKEMTEQGEKAATETNNNKSLMHQAASHEAAKFYQMIEMVWIDNADFTIKENQ
jgi:hypothetical protein